MAAASRHLTVVALRDQRPTRESRRASALASFAAYGHVVTPDECRARLMTALEASGALGSHNRELRGYFEVVVQALASPFSGAGEDDAISDCSDDDLEQTALLFMKNDVDGDGLLSRDEFAAIIDAVAAATGQKFAPEHVDRFFGQADVDGSGKLDLNELLLFRRKAAARRHAT